MTVDEIIRKYGTTGISVIIKHRNPEDEQMKEIADELQDALENFLEHDMDKDEE